MKRITSWLWPLLIGVLALAVTGWLWDHERQTQERNLRLDFDFGLRQTATRIEERLTAYEQILRGVRGLFEASDEVTREDFSNYVDSLLAGADFAGLRAIAYAPILSTDRVSAHVAAHHAKGLPDYTVDPPGSHERLAPVTYAAPAPAQTLTMLGKDLFADPARRTAMLQAVDSGSAAITQRLRTAGAIDPGDGQGFLLFMPLFEKGQQRDSVAARRAHVVGWVFASFRIGDLMSSLYGETTPGLDVRVHDGADVSDATRLYPAVAPVSSRPARFEAQEFIGVAGHTWTLSVRSNAEFDQQYSHDSALVIAIAGTGLSLVLTLLTWQLVTGRERAAAAARTMTRQLREGAERYRRIVETANEGIWMVDADGRTTFANPKMKQMLGLGADELLAHRWFDFMDDGGRAAMAGEGLDHLKKGFSGQRELRLHRKDGSDLWATVSTSPIVDESGGYAGALAMVTDVTERKEVEIQRAQLEGQLRQSQKMEAIGTLAGGIAHDFNNIIAAILGNASLALQDLGKAHPAAARLEQIHQAGARGRSLVQQIVAFSRREPQQRVVQPLRPLIEDAAKLLRATMPTRVELELRLSDSPMQVSADGTQLQQVLMNLCTNAWHAMTSGSGRIAIGLEVTQIDARAAERLGSFGPGRYAHLWVNDDGCGMDEATRLRIFEPFYTTKPVGQGSGLGLSVVHGIVTSHGGAITVDSVPDCGASFDIYLPLVALPGSAMPLPAAEPAAVQGQGQHVLYVDDDPVTASMVEALLQRTGYRVTCLGDPRKALSRASALDDAVDVVVTDYNMPDLSGLDLARQLHLTRPALPVILTTGYVAETLRDEALRCGVRHVLQKEYSLEQLGALIQRALSERVDGAMREA